MKRAICLSALAAFALAFAATAPTKAADPPAEEPSIKGTWVGSVTTGGLKVKLTVTLKADGTYKTVSELSDIVSVERGKYKYSDGILETEPDGGFAGTYKVTWEGRDTMVVKGGGLTVTFKREGR